MWPSRHIPITECLRCRTANAGGQSVCRRCGANLFEERNYADAPDVVDERSEAKRAATEKAREGRRLLDAGDYCGAIAPCAEAIKLAPDFPGPYQTRAAAYGHLGMEKEAEADRQHLIDLGRRTQDASPPVKGFSRKGKLGLLFSVIFWTGFAAVFLGLIFSGVLDDAHGVYLRWPPIWLYVVSGGGVLFSVMTAINDDSLVKSLCRSN